ncbi:MAG TPA: hypothetical protein VN455_02215 [Methanotrichaceae archaeon]|nr:hypothetical protein [Methanotrichaceae archaeon]
MMKVKISKDVVQIDGQQIRNFRGLELSLSQTKNEVVLKIILPEPELKRVETVDMDPSGVELAVELPVVVRKVGETAAYRKDRFS